MVQVPESPLLIRFFARKVFYMANKRMFNMKICDSDAFLDMPLSTQALYFHLNMRADDDGFVGNPKRIQRTIGASEDDLKLLKAKRFVLEFEDGVIVIKHWRMHNCIQKDRYTPTVYQDEMQMLYEKKNKSYTLDETKSKCIQNGNNMYTNTETKCIQNVSSDIDIDIDIGLYNSNARSVDRFEEFWDAYPKKVHRILSEQAYVQSLINGSTEEWLINAAKEYALCMKGMNDKYIKNPENWLKEDLYLDYPTGTYARKCEKAKEQAKEQEKKEKKSSTRFNNFEERSYNMDSLEKQLLGLQ